MAPIIYGSNSRKLSIGIEKPKNKKKKVLTKKVDSAVRRWNSCKSDLPTLSVFIYFFRLLGIRFVKFDRKIPNINISTKDGNLRKSLPIS